MVSHGDWCQVLKSRKYSRIVSPLPVKKRQSICSLAAGIDAPTPPEKITTFGLQAVLATKKSYAKADCRLCNPPFITDRA